MLELGEAVAFQNTKKQANKRYRCVAPPGRSLLACLRNRAMSRSTGATVAARARSSLVCLTVVYVCILPIAAFQQSIGMARGSSSCSSRRTGHTPAPVIVKDSSPVLPARAFAAARGSGFRREPSRRNWWVAAGSSAAAVQDAPPTTNFDCAQISNVLEHEYRADLVRLAQKYGELIESAEDVETISIMELDG